MMNRHEDKIDCRKCKFLYVTWDKDFPYGCRAIGFKSKLTPSVVVYQSSMMVCQKFEPRR